MKFCFRCGKQFTRNNNLIRHLNNKNICPEKYLNVSREMIINDYDKYLSNYIMVYNQSVIESDVPVTDSKNESVTKSDHPVTNSDVLLCPDCGKSYTKRNSLNAHRNRYCSYKKQKVLKEQIIDLNMKMLELQNKQNILEEEKNQETEQLNNKIKALELKLVVTNGNINNGSIQNADTINNNNNINIHITNYGEENLSHMTTQDWELILAKEFDMLLKFVEYVHLDNEMNRNIYIPSIKNAVALIRQGEKWISLEKKSFISKMLIDKRLQLQEAINTHGDDFTNVSKTRAQAVFDYVNNDEEELKRLKTETTLLLTSNKDVVKDTYEKSYCKKIII